MSKKYFGWELDLGVYPGILLGVRSYREKWFTEHVLYLPFVDVCVRILYTSDEE